MAEVGLSRRRPGGFRADTCSGAAPRWHPYLGSDEDSVPSRALDSRSYAGAK